MSVVDVTRKAWACHDVGTVPSCFSSGEEYSFQFSGECLHTVISGEHKN